MDPNPEALQLLTDQFVYGAYRGHFRPSRASLDADEGVEPFMRPPPEGPLAMQDLSALIADGYQNTPCRRMHSADQLQEQTVLFFCGSGFNAYNAKSSV